MPRHVRSSTAARPAASQVPKECVSLITHPLFLTWKPQTRCYESPRACVSESDHLDSCSGSAINTSEVCDLIQLTKALTFDFLIYQWGKWASLEAQTVKNLPVMWEAWVPSLNRERSPGEGNGNPLQDSCLENPMDRGAWKATVHGVAKSWTWLITKHSKMGKRCSIINIRRYL